MVKKRLGISSFDLNKKFKLKEAYKYAKVINLLDILVRKSGQGLVRTSNGSNYKYYI